mmetsp:Transcript_23812/g.39924  ORF Transcript_23812/g.39924 Transcript_23812/m.39924 type:complete len:87 (-) Transcript_23812:257-517(-)
MVAAVMVAAVMAGAVCNRPTKTYSPELLHGLETGSAAVAGTSTSPSVASAIVVTVTRLMPSAVVVEVAVVVEAMVWEDVAWEATVT